MKAKEGGDRVVGCGWYMVDSVDVWTMLADAIWCPHPPHLVEKGITTKSTERTKPSRSERAMKHIPWGGGGPGGGGWRMTDISPLLSPEHADMAMRDPRSRRVL